MKRLFTILFAMTLGFAAVGAYADEKAAEKPAEQATSGDKMSTILIETTKGNIKV